jgi:hypothetical protein
MAAAIIMWMISRTVVMGRFWGLFWGLSGLCVPARTGRAVLRRRFYTRRQPGASPSTIGRSYCFGLWNPNGLCPESGCGGL